MSFKKDITSLEQTVDKLEDTIVFLTNRQPFRDYLVDIRENYDRLTSTSKRVRRDDIVYLRKICKDCKNYYPEQPLSRQIDNLGDWLDAALSVDATISIEAWRFEEDAWGGNHPMNYRIEVFPIPGSKPKTRYSSPLYHVDGEKKVGKPPHNKKKITVPWNPQTRVSISVSYGNDKQNKKSRVFYLDNNHVLKLRKDGELEKKLSIKGNSKFRFVYRLTKKGFGPLPARP